MYLSNLADVFRKICEFSKAIEIYNSAVEIISRILGPQDVEIADISQNKALVYIDLKRFDEAENELNFANQIVKEKLGKDHPKMGYCLHKFGLLHVARENFKQAEQCYNQSLKILQKSLDLYHPEVADVLISLGELQTNFDKNAAITSLSNALQIIFFCFGKNHYKYASICDYLNSLNATIPEFTKPVASSKGFYFLFFL